MWAEGMGSMLLGGPVIVLGGGTEDPLADAVGGSSISGGYTMTETANYQ